jgi:hypothetical protein
VLLTDYFQHTMDNMKYVGDTLCVTLVVERFLGLRASYDLIQISRMMFYWINSKLRQTSLTSSSRFALLRFNVDDNTEILQCDVSFLCISSMPLVFNSYRSSVFALVLSACFHSMLFVSVFLITMVSVSCSPGVDAECRLAQQEDLAIEPTIRCHCWLRSCV